MRIWVHGASHLTRTLARAATMRGFELGPPPGHVLFSAHDVLDHTDLDESEKWFDGALAMVPLNRVPIVLVSQVPPGTTRKWAGARASEVFYQVDTIIMKQALSRAYAPEQIIVGCADPEVPLPLAYQEYLMVHECPILQMSYESAEMAKCAINYMLAKQIETANILLSVCEKGGADYEDVRAALHNDARIGQSAYLRPGEPNQHLLRDMDTIHMLRGRSD